MELIYTLLSFLFVITILVFVHEFGHFWVARRAGVKVEVFSIGFGRELFGFTDKYGTRWKFSMIPAGGYVKMFGDKNSASQPDEELMDSISEEEKKFAFQCKSLKAKAAIVAAGPIANYIFAILIFFAFFKIYGAPFAEPIITKILENSPASKAGLLVGDKILEINDEKIESFNDISNIMNLNTGEEVRVLFKRNGEVLNKKIIPEVIYSQDPVGNELKMFKLGVMADHITLKSQGVFSAAKLAVVECYNLSYMSLKALGQIIAGKRSVKELGGPIKIAQYSAKTAELGVLSLLSFIALLSVNLGLMNLLPIPVLDGGYLLIYFIELVFGKKNANKVQDFGFQIGIILLIMLTVLVTFNDLDSFFMHKGQK